VPFLNAGLREIMCFGEVRTVSRDPVVMFGNWLFQILPGKYRHPRPKGKVTVRIRTDKSPDICFAGKKHSVRESEKTKFRETA